MTIATSITVFQFVASGIKLSKPHLFYNTMSDLTRTALIKLIAVATKPLNLSGINLQGVDLSYLDLTKADLRGANLSGACLFQANLSGGGRLII